MYPIGNCPGIVQNVKSPAHCEYEDNDSGLFDKAVVQCGEDLPRLRLGTGYDPGGGCSLQDEYADYDESVRETFFQSLQR